MVTVWVARVRVLRVRVVRVRVVRVRVVTAGRENFLFSSPPLTK